MSDSDRVVELLEELLVWTRAGMYGRVSELIQAEFKQHAEERSEIILAYELLDGSRTYKEIVQVCKASIPDARIAPSTLSSWVAKWERLGLLKKEGSTPVKLFSLADFAIEIPGMVDPPS